MIWLKEKLRQLRVVYCLGWSRKRPESLPNPMLRPLTRSDKGSVERLRSVCIFLGPYRNLTTLTGSILFLHPNCQVLNHAGPRVLNNETVNFLSDYSDEKFEQFCHFVITMSQGGARGAYGGSMLLSHAFADHQSMRKIYLRRFGASLLKPEIKSLVWKESQRVSQYIREHQVDLGYVLAKNPTISFLMPIRNPLDCAKSIARLGLQKSYGEKRNEDIYSVLDHVLEEIHWFISYHDLFPKKFFYFFQDQFNEETLRKMADFLELTHDERWIQDSLSVIQLKEPYRHDPNLVAYYHKQINKIFREFPSIKKHLSRMVPIE